jgi:hypothetical protein
VLNELHDLSDRERDDRRECGPPASTRSAIGWGRAALS